MSEGPWGKQWDAEFLRGQVDCKEGRPHLPHQGQAYDRGFRAEYELQQVRDALSGGGVWKK